MKYYTYLLLSLFVVSTNALAYQPKIEIIEQFDNLRMIAFISKEDVDTNPVWNPDLEEIPLTVFNAIKAVKKFNSDIHEVKEIEIRPFPHHEKQWHYLIKVSNDKMKSKYSVYAVLMSGKVIPAIIEPQGYK